MISIHLNFCKMDFISDSDDDFINDNEIGNWKFHPNDIFKFQTNIPIEWNLL